MKIIDKWGKGRRTMWEVQSGSSKMYTVMVDSDGVWHCSCPSAQFRGNCCHIWGIRITREWHTMYPQIERIDVTPLGERVLLKLMEMPRFILQYKYPGPRYLIAFGLKVHANGGIAKLQTATTEKLAGTVVEVVHDGVGTYYCWDCLWFKGWDIRQLPLRDRLIKAAEVAEVWNFPGIEETPIEIDIKKKFDIYENCGGQVILKDIGAPYVNRPRYWLKRR